MPAWANRTTSQVEEVPADSPSSNNGSNKITMDADVYKSFVRYYGRLLTMSEFFTPLAKRFSPSDPLSDPFTQLAAVFACAQARARPLASAPLKVYERKILNGVETLEEVKEHPLVEMISVPNPIMSRYQYIQAWELSVVLGGECFYFLDRNGFTDVPKDVWLLPPGSMEEIPDERGMPIGWEYKPSGSRDSIRYELWQIMHEKEWNPHNFIRGLSPLLPLDIVLESEWASLVFNLKFMENGCEPSGRYEVEGMLHGDIAKALLKQHEDKYSGAANTGSVMVDEGGIKWKPYPIPQKDAQFLELRERNLTDIMMALGCNHGALGLPDTNYAQLKVMLRHFWTATLIPRVRAMEDAMWKDITRHIEGGKYEILFDLNAVEALREDITEKAGSAKTYWEMGAPFSEVNRNLALGFEPFPGWDISYPTAPGQAGAPAPKEAVATVEKDEATVFDVRTPAEIEYAEKFDREVVRPLEKQFAAKMSRFFDEHRREMLKKFKKRTGWTGKTMEPRSWRPAMRLAGMDLTPIEEYQKADEPMPGADFSKFEFMPSRFEQNKKIERYTKSLYEEGILRGAVLRNAELGTPQAIVEIDDVLAKWIEENGLDMAKDMVGTLQDELRETLSEGIKEGETLAELAARIKHVHKEAGNRAMTIARTEMGRAAEHGAYEEAKESGIVKGHRWITGGKNIRDAHLSAHRQYQDLGKKFVMGDGVRLLHPHDPGGPVHSTANCKCVLEPVLEGEE